MEAVSLDPAMAEAFYNLGLLQVKTGDYEAALESARQAYGLGYPLPGLMKKLKKAGYWKTEPHTEESSVVK